MSTENEILVKNDARTIMNQLMLLEAIFSTNVVKRQLIEKKISDASLWKVILFYIKKIKTNKQKETKNETKYSRMDQVKFVEDSLKKFEVIWSA